MMTRTMMTNTRNKTTPTEYDGSDGDDDAIGDEE